MFTNLLQILENEDQAYQIVRGLPQELLHDSSLSRYKEEVIKLGLGYALPQEHSERLQVFDESDELSDSASDSIPTEGADSDAEASSVSEDEESACDDEPCRAYDAAEEFDDDDQEGTEEPADPVPFLP